MKPQSLEPDRTRSGFVRGFSWLDVFMFVVATPAASGVVYYAVSMKADFPGASIPLAFVLGLVLFVPICLLLAITSATLPRSGGLYVLISRVISPSIGYVAAWLLFVGYGLCIGMFGYIVMGILGGTVRMAGGDSLAGLAQQLQSPTGKSIGGVIWVLALWLCFSRGIGWIKGLLRVSLLVALAGTAVAVIAFLLVGPKGAANTFGEAWGAGSFEKITSAAKGLGWAPAGFSLTATGAALLIVLWAYTTIEAINYAGSEIQAPGTNTIRGFMLGLAVVGALYILIAFSVYYCFGSFVDSYAFLHTNHREVLSEIMSPIDPSIPFFATSVLVNRFAALAVSVSLVLWFFNSMPGVFLASSRIAYALSADNLFPRAMQRVNDAGVPVWATRATALLGLGGVALMSLKLTQVLSVFNFCFLFVFWAYGLSAMLLPYKRPVIYENAPLKVKVAGVPLISLLGLIVFLEGWYFLFLAIQESGTAGSLVIMFILMVGLMVNLYYRKRHFDAGVDLQETLTKVPLD